MVPRKHSDSGFTLVELLVVMVVIGIMSSMVAIAVQGVTASARASRTRTIIGMIDSVIQEKYDSYKYRSLPVEIPATDFAGKLTGTTLSFEVLGSEAARVRLNMIRDLQRMEMPDRFQDFDGVPSSVWGAANPVMLDASDNVIGTRSTKTARVPFQMSWYKLNSEPSQVQSYQRRLTTSATLEYQSAECLYLILATSYSSGTPAIDAIPTSNIGDLDGDGMFEIWDAWGQPIGFIRWPVGYSDPDGIIDYTTADEFDLFRSDFYYTVQTPPAPSSTSVLPAVNVNTGSAIAPWALRPLVISAGEDGDFGIAFNPIDDGGTPLSAFSYANASWDWPKDAANMGAEWQGRGTASYQWCDPYLRRFLHDNDVSVLDRTSATYATDTSRRLPGEELTGGPNQALADNITNFSLQVAQ
ncbi:prepilin-type N-terminal cleavage/methylation domain-containing protein [Neorhodopirellula lusitana]|uniref:prepilin-type N-terminal cleavage/methylation domain-containing protein n=1 Tax=Neorhodopirellula lusitana TaxID=445327 RepID=UPI003850AF92